MTGDPAYSIASDNRRYYHGFRGPGRVQVYVEEPGYRAELAHLGDHSPTGFEWGYGGSGPTDLAISILTDALGPEAAERWAEVFKWKVIAVLPPKEFILTWEACREMVQGWETPE